MAERDTTTHVPLVLDVMQRTTGGSFSCSLQFILFRKGKDEKPGKLKVNMLFNCAGPEAMEE